MNILTAKVAPIPIGTLEIEGLLFENGTFGIAQQQVAMLFSVMPTSAPKWVKGILGNDIQLFSVKTDRNENTKQNRPEKALALTQFERLIVELTIKGDPTAISFSRLLIGLSLEQLFSDGFGIAFEVEDRQEWLKERMESKVLFWELTEAIRDTRQSTGKEINSFHYSTPMNTINRGLFGKTAKEIRLELGIPDSALNRDSFGKKSLRWLTNVQESSALRVRHGDKPCDAITHVIRELGYSVINFRE